MVSPAPYERLGQATTSAIGSQRWARASSNAEPAARVSWRLGCGRYQVNASTLQEFVVPRIGAAVMLIEPE
jgi:hypothetical protein